LLSNPAISYLDKQASASKVAGNGIQRVLICTPSNAAVDEVLSRLYFQGIYDDKPDSFAQPTEQGLAEGRRRVKIVRLGEGLETASTLIKSLSLESQVEAQVNQHPLFQTMQNILLDLNRSQSELELFIKQNDDFRSYDSRGQVFRHENHLRILSEKGDCDSKQQREYKLLNASIRNYKSLESDVQQLRREKFRCEVEIEKIRNDFRADILRNADVVGCTLSASGRSQFAELIAKQQLLFPTVIIDEAGQTTEPSTLLPLRFGCRKLVLVGDPRQLPPTVLSRRAEQAGLNRSLFERLERGNHEVVMLSIQYRMHPEIRLFPSKHFYNNLLTDSDAIQQEILAVQQQGRVFLDLLLLN
jgi:senataxin